MIKMIKELFKYRELFKSNIKKEIRGKYKGSFLGVLWSFVNPLLMTIVYAIVFPFILRDGPEHYVTFIVIGIIPWNFFTTAMSQGTTTILANAAIIKKVYFPREILPISVATSSLINFFIAVPIMIIFLIFSGIGLTPYILLLPLIAIIQYIFVLGIIFITSTINVYIRDAEYIVNFIISMLFYATPILYSPELFGDKAWILKLNPLTTIISSYRDILYEGTLPNIKSLILVFLGSVTLLFIGFKVFKKLSKGFAEEV